MSALPSPLKSAAAISCQSAPGLKPTLAPLRIFEPSISHAAGVPSWFCHRMSALPSPLKSPESITCQAAPGAVEVVAGCGCRAGVRNIRNVHRDDLVVGHDAIERADLNHVTIVVVG